MLEKKLPREIVESEYKKYIPKECIKRHAFLLENLFTMHLQNYLGMMLHMSRSNI